MKPRALLSFLSSSSLPFLPSPSPLPPSPLQLALGFGKKNKKKTAQNKTEVGGAAVTQSGELLRLHGNELAGEDLTANRMLQTRG